MALYSTFLQRAYDMILQDIAMLHLHVVFAIDRAGLVGEDGETHQGDFDVSFLSSIPNIDIYSPATYDELRFYIKSKPKTRHGTARTVKKKDVPRNSAANRAIITRYPVFFGIPYFFVIRVTA